VNLLSSSYEKLSAFPNTPQIVSGMESCIFKLNQIDPTSSFLTNYLAQEEIDKEFLSCFTTWSAFTCSTATVEIALRQSNNGSKRQKHGNNSPPPPFIHICFLFWIATDLLSLFDVSDRLYHYNLKSLFFFGFTVRQHLPAASKGL
jgi:hypothetical protein